MIFDPEIEFQNIDDQLEIIGLPGKVKSLQDKRTELMNKYSKFENDKILDAVTVIDNDLKLFESIISLWISNLEKMKRLFESFEGSIIEINKGAKQLNLINDLNTAYNYERNENIILSESFVKLAESKGIDSKKMNDVLNDLRVNVKRYIDFINTKLNE